MTSFEKLLIKELPSYHIKKIEKCSVFRCLLKEEEELFELRNLFSNAKLLISSCLTVSPSESFPTFEIVMFKSRWLFQTRVMSMTHHQQLLYGHTISTTAGSSAGTFNYYTGYSPKK